MKQPLMLTPVRIPPAQAEALYDASLESGRKGLPVSSEALWANDDWDDDAVPSYPVLPEKSGGVIAQH